MADNRSLALQSNSVIPTSEEWGTIHTMAKSLLPTGFLPDTIKTPEQATAIILKGRELQIPPMYALSNVVIIKGKPSCSAELLQALIYRDHGDDALRFTETTNEKCTIEYRRRSWKKPERYTFTIKDAQQAGLNSMTWKQYPAAMLRARCLSAVARMAFADSIGGMHTMEELGAPVRVEGDVVVYDDAAVIETESRVVPPQITAEVVDDTISLDALTKIQIVRQRRSLTAEDLQMIAARRYEVERLEEMTVDQGRDLYRLIDKESDEGLEHELWLAQKDAADIDADGVIDIGGPPTEQAELMAGDAARFRN